MSNAELIDNYLTNRLNEEDRKSFEQQMALDPALKADVELQRDIIQGLKAARIADLKAMLSKVPLSTPTLYFSPLRIAAGLIGAAVLATGLYYYYDKNTTFNPNQISSSLVDSIRQKEQTTNEIQTDSLLIELNQEEKNTKEAEVAKEKSKDQSLIENSGEQKPSLDLLDPTEDLEETEITSEQTHSGKATIAVAKIDVSVNSTERRFKSHYQFSNGKLLLYGNFDSSLYEIIEVNGQNSRSLFLFSNNSYFILDETKKEITLLKEISDPVLIQKLTKFRSK